MRQLLATIILLISSFSSLQAGNLNIQLGSESGRFLYASEAFAGRFGPVDMEFALFFNDEEDYLGHIGLLVRNDTMDNPFVISVGTRLYYGDVGNAPTQTNADIGGIAIGGEVLFIPDNLGGLGFGIHYYYVPGIVAFMDAEDITEYGARLEYAITQQASIYIGYQKIEAGLENGTDLEIDDNTHIGISLRF
jgi:hypothetical protein